MESMWGADVYTRIGDSLVRRSRTSWLAYAQSPCILTYALPTPIISTTKRYLNLSVYIIIHINPFCLQLQRHATRSDTLSYNFQNLLPTWIDRICNPVMLGKALIILKSNQCNVSWIRTYQNNHHGIPRRIWIAPSIWEPIHIISHIQSTLSPWGHSSAKYIFILHPSPATISHAL